MIDVGKFLFPEFPSRSQQIDALKKGLGRAWCWAKKGRLDPALLLDACLYDHRYDYQCDDPRGTWLWSIVASAQLQSQFKDVIFEALGKLDEKFARDQLCEFAIEYAMAGDTRFKDRLYEIVLNPPGNYDPCTAFAGILRLDGTDGLIFSAKLNVKTIEEQGWTWRQDSLIEDAIETLGKSTFERCLQNSNDENVVKFLLRRNQATASQELRSQMRKPSHEERMRKIGVQDILNEAKKEKPRLGWFRGWGMHADESDLEEILDWIRISSDPYEIKNLLRPLAARQLPMIPDWIFERYKVMDSSDHSFLYKALSHDTDSRIRNFAFDRLLAGDFSAAVMLVNNFHPGDEPKLLEYLERELQGAEDLHWCLCDVFEILQANAFADLTELAPVVYFMTPCETCRSYVVKLMVERNAMPDWIRQECQFDSRSATRQAVAVSK